MLIPTSRRITMNGLIISNGLICADPGNKSKVPIELIRPNPDQPRKTFIEETLSAMAISLKKRGDVEYPLLVTISKDGTYAMIIDGERRWRASQLAKLKEISCIFCDQMEEREIHLVSAKGNLCREDMTPIEKALMIKKLMADFDWNQTEVANEIGATPPHVSNMLKYLKLTPEIQSLVLHRKLDNGVALQLATYQPHDQGRLLKVIETEVEKRGKRLHPNEASRILRGAAEKKGLKPAVTKRGQKHSSHADLSAKNVLRQIENNVHSVREFLALPADAVRNIKGCHFLDILREAKRLNQDLEKLINKLERID